jgi:hypothetical protein
MASHAQMRTALKCIQPPSTEEVFEELRQSVERLQRHRDFDAVCGCCIATRSAFACLVSLAMVNPLRIRKSVVDVDRLFDQSLEALAHVDEKRVAQYADSIRTRATLVKRLRRGLRHR